MTDASPPNASPPNAVDLQDSPTGPPGGRWLLLGTAIIQFVSPAFVTFGGFANDPPIVPPGPFFSIWGVITTGSLVVALWGLPTRRAASPLYQKIQIPLSLVHLGFVAWLGAATSKTAVWLTLPIFLGMLGGTAACLREVYSADAATSDAVTQPLVGGAIGLYAGWSTAAVWLNILTLLPTELLSGDLAVPLQGAAIAGASCSAAIGTYLLRGQATYTLAAAWALVGITISSVKANLIPLAITSGAGLVTTVAVTVLRRLGG
jgi:hypothetical protein